MASLLLFFGCAGVDNSHPLTFDLAATPDASVPVDMTVPVDAVDAAFQCITDNECPQKALPRCDRTAHVCVACQPENDNCPVGAFCASQGNDAGNDWVCAAGCKADRDCLSDGGAQSGRCDVPKHQCVRCLGDGDCAVGSICKAGACVDGCSMIRPCSKGLACCQSQCADITNDIANCGACGNACMGGFACCGGACINPVQDLQNCGACGTVCTVSNGTPACVARACAIQSCQKGFADCNGVYKDGCETNTDTTVINCGHCGTVCFFSHAAPRCTGGVCQIDTCLFPWSDCNGDPTDGCEANTGANDPNNCGGCGRVCPSKNGAAACNNGVCSIVCSMGFADCNGIAADGCERAIATDPANCGACNVNCSNNHIATPSCFGGVCNGACDTGYADCDNNKLVNGCEINTQTDNNNCGACGVACVNGKTCKGGQCISQSTTMAWTDPATGSCTGTISTTMAQIANAMPATPTTVTISAVQVMPNPGYGTWTDTFPNTTCVKKWLSVWAARDVNTYNNWSPAVCQATDMSGTAFYFVLKNDGGNNPQVAIYPVGANAGQYMSIYLLDRTFAWCDLAGVENRPGFDSQVTNGNTFGDQGDSLTFTWQ